MNPKRIVLFASGTGSNAARIIEHFAQNEQVEVVMIISNRSKAKVLELGPRHGIPTLVIGRSDFYEGRDLLQQLQDVQADLLVLAGFLWLVPPYLVEAYPQAIINIHPALLPKFGGKGMYGMNVHRAVVEQGEAESGITIHYVNQQYDDGATIFQASCPVLPNDTPEELAARVLKLEHTHFPLVVERLLLDSK